MTDSDALLGWRALARWTVDSIEEGIVAVLPEEGELFHLPVALLPDAVREGDVLMVRTREGEAGATRELRIEVNREATDEALRRSREQLDRHRAQNDPGGDIVL